MENNNKITSSIAAFRKAIIEHLFSLNGDQSQVVACDLSTISAHGRVLQRRSSDYTGALITGKRIAPIVAQFFEWTPSGAMQLEERHKVSRLSGSASWRVF